MLAFYGSRISEHMTKTPEGYLICHGVPIARTGVQPYLPSEIGMEGTRMINVYRVEDEVFSKPAIASFEGKPVTEEHPPIAVTADNYAMFLKGHAQNVHRGTGDQSDLLLADLIINDQELIKRIEDGLREVSCGYECSYEQRDDGRLYQCQIRGNHIAVVAAGRAGSRVSIKDHKPVTKGAGKPMKKTSMFGRIFAHWAQDADPDEVAAAVDAMVEEEPEEELKDADPTADPTTTDPAAAPQNDSDGEVLMLLRQILSKLGGGVGDAVPQDPMQQLVDELENGGQPVEPEKEQVPDAFENEESATVPAEEMTDEESKELTGENPIPGADSAATIAALKAMRPYMAKLSDKDRRAANDAITRAVRTAMGKSATPTVDGYAALMRAKAGAAKRRTSDRKAVSDTALGERIMAARNPHYKK